MAKEEKQDSIFKYIVAKWFFKEYAPKVKNWRKKLIKKNTNGHPIDFTKEDNKQIQSGLKQLFKDLKEL